MKTPEDMAEEYCREWWGNYLVADYLKSAVKAGFLAGYQAAKEEDKAKMQELKTNWKFCCEDKARLLNELAVAERAKDQLADADKVICNTTMEEIKAVDTGEITPITNLPTSAKWISVKERLPEIDKYVLVTHRTSQDYANLKVMEACRISDDQYEIWGDHAILADYVDYWMPLPKPPKEEK